jgi:oligosaccharyl transferase (archaeosortase A-associated)
LAKVKSMNKYKEKTDKKKKNNIGKENGTFFNTSPLSYIIVIAIFLFSFYIRGITPINNVFRNGIVGFAMDDSVFHMRLVENTIKFFPHRISFDAFTVYPYGNSLHWGPLFDQMIAFLALLGGLFTNGGMPSQSLIDTIGAFYPAVLGALVVFPVYFIGKELLDEKAGLLGAFLIAILPGQFLSRSVLGFTDNHVAEVLFVTLMMMFFIIAIKKAENITFDHWLNKDWVVLKIPIIYSLFAGVSFGAYLLTWTNGVFFAAVFGIFVIIQYIIDHFKGKSTEYLGIVGIIAYLVALIMVIPYVQISNDFSPEYYSFLHLAVTGGGAVVFALMSLVSREMSRREYKGTRFLLFVSGTILTGLIAMKILLPAFYGATVGQIDYLFKGNTGGGLTVAEAMPPCGDSIIAKLNCDTMLSSFGLNYYISFIALILLFYYIFKKSRAEYTLMAIWSIFVLGIFFAQNRFGYYYAVNIAILSAIVSSKILDYGDWKNFKSNDIIGCIKKIRVQHVLSLILVIAITGFLNMPQYPSPYQITTESAQWGAVDTSNGFYEWHDALTWMRDHTPVPDLPFYSIYNKPAPGEKYNYSKNDYGVMSWWDYGHIITYWGHRIPNANPFQSGIGGGPDHLPGASTFLTAQSEEEANAVLDRLSVNGQPGARYVVSNAYMAYSIQPVFATWNESDIYGQFTQISQKDRLFIPGMKFYNTMESRLHIFDGNGLKYYRLVHESKPNPNTRGGYLEVGAYMENNNVVPYCDQGLCVGKYWYNKVYNENVPVEYSGYAKIFEYVKGARITGKAYPNTQVTVMNSIRTNIGRTFPYSQVTMSDGTFVFTVPYSTEGPIQGGTQFDTQPTGAYTITSGNVTKQININERDVLEGRTITVDL